MLDCKHSVGIALHGGDEWCEHCGALRRLGAAVWQPPSPLLPPRPDPDERSVAARKIASEALRGLADKLDGQQRCPFFLVYTVPGGMGAVGEAVTSELLMSMEFHVQRLREDHYRTFIEQFEQLTS